MPELHLRSAGLGGRGACGVELERGGVLGRGHGADGDVGAEEGAEVPAGVWEGVSREEVGDGAGNLVRRASGVSVLGGGAFS